MAYNANKNAILFERAQAWARSIQNLLEERNRLISIVANEATGHADFVDVDGNTIAELVDLKEVMDSLAAMVNGTPVTTTNRVSKLTPFLL